MFRSALLSLGLAAFTLGLVGCGGESSPKVSEEEKKKKADAMQQGQQNMQQNKMKQSAEPK